LVPVELNWPMPCLGGKIPGFLVIVSFFDKPSFFFKLQVCKIVEGQRYSKRLNEKQITNLLKVTCQRPHERELDILQVFFFFVAL
jgi:hypothetical protein